MPEISINVGGRLLGLQCHQDEYEKSSRAARLLDAELAKWANRNTHGSSSELLVIAAMSLASRLVDQSAEIDDIKAASATAIATPEDASEIVSRIDSLQNRIIMLTSEMTSLNKMIAGSGDPSGSTDAAGQG